MERNIEDMDIVTMTFEETQKEIEKCIELDNKYSELRMKLNKRWKLLCNRRKELCKHTVTEKFVRNNSDWYGRLEKKYMERCTICGYERESRWNECPKCECDIDLSWAHCARCGHKLKKEDES